MSSRRVPWNRQPALWVLAAAQLSFAASAFAQEAAAPEPAPAASGDTLGEIVVTAQRRSQNLQEVPVAVSAVSEDFLEARDITSIDRLGSIAPNVKIERAPSNSTIAQISIRGSVTINPAITWEPAVGIYLDGIYIGKSQGAFFDVADLERVEVLRGPQGTLYGRNTLAGAVNIITKKPSGELGGKFEASYGNYDYWRLRGSLDLPAFGIFSAKVSGQIQGRDGFIDIVPNPIPGVALAGEPSFDEVSNLDSKSGLVQLRAEPSDAITFDYMFDISVNDQQPNYSQLLRTNQNFDPNRPSSFSDIFDPRNPFGVSAFLPLNLYANPERQDTASIDSPRLREYSKTWGHALTASFDLGDATLKSITAYRKLRWEDSLDLDGSPLPIALTERFSRYKSFSQELQLTGEMERLNYVFGLYYFDDSAFTNNPQFFFGNSQVFDSQYGSDTTAYAAYGQVDFEVTDTLTLTGGLRYTHEKKDIERVLRVLAAPAIPAAFLPVTVLDYAKGDVPDAKYNTLTPTFIVRYEPTDAVNLYAKYAKGYKSGGFNGETSFRSELENPYDPEKVDSFEIGMKSRLLDDRLQLNLAGFLDEHKDIQLSVFTGRDAAASIVLNAAKARIWGIEVEATAKPSNRLLVNASFSYLNAKYKEFIDADIDVSDNRAFPHTPKYNAALNVDWTAWEGDFGTLNLIGDLNYVSEYFTFPYALRTTDPSAQNARNTRSEGRVIADARAVLSEIPLGGVQGSFSLWVRNLFNEDEPSNFIDFGPGFGGLTVGYFPDPRTYGVTLGVRF